MKLLLTEMSVSRFSQSTRLCGRLCMECEGRRVHLQPMQRVQRVSVAAWRRQCGGSGQTGGENTDTRGPAQRPHQDCT